MESIPPLTIGTISYISNGKAVIALFPDGVAYEFETVANAKTYLENEKLLGTTAAFFARIFELKDGDWIQV
jgi:hypothetical protein